MESSRQYVSRDGFLLDKISDGILVADAEGTVRFANPAAEDLLGRNVGDLVGQPIGLPIIDADFTEVNLIRPDGQTRYAELRIVEAEWEEHPAYVLSLRDVTLRHEAEEERARNQRLLAERERQIFQSQKMDAVGQLAAGIAHDFNNMLSTIIGYAALIKSMIDSEVGAHAEKIVQTSERAAGLVRQLLAFSRNQVLQPRVWSVNQIAQESVDLFRRLLPENIEIALKLSPHAGNVKVDREQVEQALVNLLLNAKDAMPDGGTIEIETELVRTGDAMPAGVAKTSYSVLRVIDHGYGMTEEVRERAFEPFFTTKEPGHATGLGLSIVYGIVTQSDGQVRLSSELGIGTRAEILLPATEEAVSERPGTAYQQMTLARHSEMILVAEDEDALREVVCEILRRAGYRVLGAENGQVALDLFRKSGEQVNALVTDLMMPVMGGIELAEKVLRLRPRLPILYVSGYSDHKFERGPLTELLEKPFQPAVLLRILRRVLDESHGLGIEGQPN
jgi:two-component system cell cycle sensor histidine kinase/response regulator CckA